MYLLSWGSDVSLFLLTPCSSGLQTFGLPLFAWPLVVYFVSVLLMVVQRTEKIVGNWLRGLVRGLGNEAEFGSKGKE